MSCVFDIKANREMEANWRSALAVCARAGGLASETGTKADELSLPKRIDARDET